MEIDIEKYTIGIDFGTLSGRAVLLRTSDGAEIASSVYPYPHGVMDKYLLTPDEEKIKLGDNWALESPEDYLDVLANVIREVMGEGGVSAEDIVGLGIDFTICTLMPVYADRTPLCFDPRFAENPYAYVKLWKDHSSSPYAKRLTDIARERGEDWLRLYGGEIQSEWMFPKLWQILEEAPEVYEAADYFMEAGDWVTWMLTGEQTRSSAVAGFKSIFIDGKYPSKSFLRALDPRMENVPEEKLGCGKVKMLSVGERAGYITESAAKLTGLTTSCAVTVNLSDAHAAVPAAKICTPGKMLMILGTSTCTMLLSDEIHDVPGICGIVKDGFIPGMYAYEAGQSCVGDHFAWFADTLAPAEYKKEAEEGGMSTLKLLVRKMAELSPGESGLIALDWWNGNRSILVDSDLSGVFVGMSLTTKPEEMFRALVEATAFGCRAVIENYNSHGVPVTDLTACGGIAVKDPVTMQIYADVLGQEIRIAGSAHGPATGSAILAAYASGEYDTIAEASEHMGSLSDTVYRPIPHNVVVYNELYREYMTLHDYFGKDNNVMKKLKAIRSRETVYKTL